MTDTQTSSFSGSEQKPVDQLSFEEAMAELDIIVRQLENGSASLDSSIALYDRGMALRKHCEAKLSHAQARIEKITLDSNGAVSTEPLDPSQDEA